MDASTRGVIPTSQVSELLQTLVKALRAFQMYLPNNPIHQRATQNVQAAFRPIWTHAAELRLTIAETDILWEEEVVYSQVSKSESLAWGLHKDGLRELVFRPGCEDDEIVRFLLTVNRARFLAADAGDDLLTLLWEQEYLSIEYRFTEMFGDGDMDFGDPAQRAAQAEVLASPQERQAQVRDESPVRPKGVVDPDDFDSTLYFLDEQEIGYITAAMEKEYGRDVRAVALHSLFDIFEFEADPKIREEIAGILDVLFPNLLNRGDFNLVAMVLRELRVMAARAPLLRPAEQARLQSFEGKLSEPAIAQQLLQALDEGRGAGFSGGVTEVLKELRPSALETLVAFLPNTQSPEVKKLLEQTIDRIAAAGPQEVQRLLRQPDSPALEGVVRLCGRLQLQPAIAALADTLEHPDPGIRVAAVEALIAIGTPGALTQLEPAIDDDDRTVRLAAVRAVTQRGYKGALKKIEAVVAGKDVEKLDLTERMAFFEAYGTIAGASAVDQLVGMLVPRGLFRTKMAPETRACAAVALGRIRTEAAREALRRCADDKDLVVRNAVSRALRSQPQ